ncbi:thioredoxin family protein [Hymenobacter taeanensis]|uniref:Thioredoxin family protein n=1 Tax=Hymenobacter taeanensis TaxID=2735321 RepID=A0A6M6BLP4_9BACT|nr:MULTISPECIES: thioredoxin family protein [Hymenobacter]QJX48758.1 thioredoxin family protein [Hymenobacter taeanensis]UOQ81736.1 thioredoxin family protein [Hymenobacter sp. 5414T-23]
MKKLLPFLAACLVLALSSFIVLRPVAAGYQVGDKATDFKLKNVDGKMVSLADNKTAKGYIVVFTCNTCPYAQAYESRILALHQKYARQGYPVVAINPNDPAVAPGDSFADMQKRAKAKQYAFPYLQDETQQIAKAYGATRTPHLYVLTRQGNDFIVSYIGAIDDNSEDASQVKTKYLENAMTDIIAGKPASVNSTKAIGCTIKWKRA